MKLAEDDFAGASPEMLAALRAYHEDPRRIASKSKRNGGPSRRKVEKALVKLEGAESRILSASK